MHGYENSYHHAVDVQPELDIWRDIRAQMGLLGVEQRVPIAPDQYSRLVRRGWVVTSPLQQETEDKERKGTKGRAHLSGSAHSCRH